MTSFTKFRNLMLSSVALLALPLAAQAQTGPGFSGAMTLGYSSSSIEFAPGADADYNALSIDVISDIAFSEAFSVGLDFSMTSGTLDAGGGLEIDLDLIGLAIEPEYHFGNGAYAGVYYRMGDLDLSLPFLPITVGVDTESYGVFGGYEHGPLWVEAFVGRSDTDPGLPGGIDIVDYGLAASYQINSQFGVFGSVLRTDIDGFGASVDLTSVAIGADYDFGNGFMAYGSLGMLNVSEPLGLHIDGNNLTIGAAYDLTTMGTPAILSAEYSRTTIDVGAFPGIDPEIDRFAVGLTIPLGGGSSMPLNSNTRTARGDYRSAIAAVVNSL